MSAGVDQANTPSNGGPNGFLNVDVLNHEDLNFENIDILEDEMRRS